MRARLDHPKFSVIWAVTGDSVDSEFELLEEVATEHTREAGMGVVSF